MLWAARGAAWRATGLLPASNDEATFVCSSPAALRRVGCAWAQNRLCFVCTGNRGFAKQADCRLVQEARIGRQARMRGDYNGAPTFPKNARAFVALDNSAAAVGVAVQSTALPAVTRRCSCLRAFRHRGIDAARRRPPDARRTRRRASAGAAAAMRRAQPSTMRRDGNGTRRPEAPERSLPAKTIIRTELPPRPELRGTTRRLVSQKFGGLRRFHAIFMNRLQERRRGVVSFPILRPFGPRPFRPHRRASSTRCSATPNEVRGSWSWVLVWAH